MDEQKLVAWLQAYLEIRPDNIECYQQATTTRQYKVLAFLGDAVLGFVVTDSLVGNVKQQEAGDLTIKRSSITSREALAQWARHHELSAVVNIPSTCSANQITDNVLAEMLEALLGAIYLDLGLEKTREVIYRLFQLTSANRSEGKEALVLMQNWLRDKHCHHENYKGLLQECLAHYGYSPPQYVELNQNGPEHEPLFTVEVTCGLGKESLREVGQGKSKGEAGQLAARKLLLKIVNTSQS